ncbi:hypothetical protein [[Eubacterium] cellulosolvens]
MEAEIKSELNPPMGTENTAAPSENIMGNDMNILIEEPPTEPEEAESHSTAVQTEPKQPEVTEPTPAPTTTPPTAPPVAPPAAPPAETTVPTMPAASSALPAKPPKLSQELLNVKVKKNFTLGKEKYRKKNYEGALKYFNQCLEIDPENSEVKFLIKKTKLKLKSASPAPVSEADNVPPALETPLEPASPPTASPLAAIPVDKNIHPKSSLSAPVAIPVTKADDTKLKDTPPEPATKPTADGPKCISCEGSGKCYWCNGTTQCDRCNGSGLFNNEPCPICSGSGNCNSCSGTGLCPWCKGSGTRGTNRVALANSKRA